MGPILFRASGVGNLMSASGKLTDTNKKYLAQVFIKEKYNREKNIENKYVDKGLAVEEDSLTLYSRFKSPVYYEKNEERYTNAYLSGTPDMIKGDMIIDVKSSYSIHTYFDSKIKLNETYYWQLQSYMALTGKKNATLAYCLTNMTDIILKDMERRLQWKMGAISDEDAVYMDAVEKLRHENIFDDIPLKDRVHEIEIARNDEDIMRMYKMIGEGRKYIKEHFGYGE